MALYWTKERLSAAKKIIKKHTQREMALAELSKFFKRQISKDAIDDAFFRYERTRIDKLLAKTPFVFVKQEETTFSELAKILKIPCTLADLCNKLDLSPRRAEELIQKAQSQGVKVHIENGHIGIKIAEPIEKVQQTKIAPIVGKQQKVAIISDTHLGSKYCLRDQLKDFIHYAYDQGVREIIHPGDWEDGIYGHGVYEVSHVGVHEQTRDLFEVLPKLPGLKYLGITGNHDQTHADANGIDFGEYVTNYFRKRGRNDVTFYGNRGAFLKLRGAVINLWHPKGGGAYAVSYGLQKKVEAYSAIKPQILFTGHWHRFCYIEERGVHAIACPTFQAGRSAFSKSLASSAPAIGGLITSWTVTKDGTLRDFNLQKRSYFEVEKLYDPRNSVDGIPVEIPLDR